MTQSIARQSNAEIHPDMTDPRFAELLEPERLLWTPRQLRDLTAELTGSFDTQLHEVLRFDEQHRWWARLALTEGIEVFLLSWLPDQHTAPHDHGGATCAFSVLLGGLTETYRYAPGPIRTRQHAAGGAIGFGAGRSHQVWNTGTVPAASVHAYSPPLVPTREYASLDDVPDYIPPLPARRSLTELAAEPVEP